jgi:hypothetical protein
MIIKLKRDYSIIMIIIVMQSSKAIRKIFKILFLRSPINPAIPDVKNIIE